MNKICLRTVALAFAFPFLASGELKFSDKNPNHLEPIPAYDSNGYDHAVFKSLIQDERAVIWMINKPSFLPENGVMIIGDRPFPNIRPNDHKRRWYIEAFRSKDQIWRYKETDSGHLTLDIKITDEVERKRKEVSREFAEAMFDAWYGVLKDTKYTEIMYRGNDGATYQFFCAPYYYGETWSPNSGIPMALRDLGLKLQEFAKSENDESSDLSNLCFQMAKNLIEEVK